MMKERRGVSPVIAVLLMIAIAISIGVLVYVWISGLAGSLTNTGGTQVADRLELVAYQFSGSNLILYIRNAGNNKVTVDEIYVLGESIMDSTSDVGVPINPGETQQIQVSLNGDYQDGQAYTVRVVASSGSIFSWTLIYGRSG